LPIALRREASVSHFFPAFSWSACGPPLSW
jgi:hypothetical protein